MKFVVDSYFDNEGEKVDYRELTKKDKEEVKDALMMYAMTSKRFFLPKYNEEDING